MISNQPMHVCLSGGGLRAAFFHLGALHGLAGDGRLQRVHQLSTVSGGSLAAAIFLAEWSKAAQRSPRLTPEDLQACSLRAFERLWHWAYACPRSRAFGSVRALTRVIVHWEAGFGSAMARQYEKLLRDDLDNGLSPLAACVLPEWRLATSDYSSGKRAMLVFNDRGQIRSTDAIYLPAEEIGVAKALSASTGIPGAFEPLRWKNHQLADGGILDNQGLRELIDTSAERLCIDASAPLAPLIWQSGWTAPLRAMDMLMEQTRGDVLISGLPIVSLRDDIPSPSAFEWREAIAALRTDLDRFTSIECDLAFLAGYQSILGRSDLPPQAPFKRSHQSTMAVWRFVNDPIATANGKIFELRKQLLQELDRGKYRVLPNWRVKDRWGPVMNFGQFYLVFTFFLVGAFYATVPILMVYAKLRLSWVALGVLLWALGILALVAMHLRRPEERVRVTYKTWLRILIGAPMALIFGTFGPLSWLATRMMSYRDGSVFSLRKKIRRVVDSLAH